jgi:hypothetical protein
MLEEIERTAKVWQFHQENISGAHNRHYKDRRSSAQVLYLKNIMIVTLFSGGQYV